MSGYVALLPYIDQAPRFNAFKSGGTFTNGVVYAANLAVAPNNSGDQNYSPFVGQIGLMQCPSDSAAFSLGSFYGSNSYKFCFGTGVLYNDCWCQSQPLQNAAAGYYNGVFGPGGLQTGIADCSDGTSNTILMGERLCANLGNFNDVYSWTAMNVPGMANTTTAAPIPAPCLALANGATFVNPAQSVNNCWTGYCQPGGGWPVAGLIYNTITTTIAPMGPSCSNTGSNSWGIYTATAKHNNTVQVVMADGAVRLCSAGMQLSTWQAAGTRNGSDLVGDF